MKIKYTKELLAMMNLFSRATGAGIKDCFDAENTIYFVVQPGDLGKAIGKGGIIVKELQHKLQRKIRIIEFHNDASEFVKNVIYPVTADSIELQGNLLIVRSSDRNTKGLLIGRNAKNLNMLTKVVQRYFTVDEIKVE